MRNIVFAIFLLWASSAQAQGLLTPSQFRDAGIAIVETARPDIEVAVRDELGITLSSASEPGLTGMQINFDNAYDLYLQDPTQLDALLDRWTRLALDRSDQVQSVERLASILRSNARVAGLNEVLAGGETPSHVVTRHFAGDLMEVLVFDSAEAFMYVTPEAIGELGLTEQEAWAAARENTPVRMGRVEVVRFPQTPPGIAVVGGGNGLASSALLNPYFCSGANAENVFFLSDRDGYWVAERAESGAIEWFRGFATHLITTGQSDSAFLLVCRDGRIAAESD